LTPKSLALQSPHLRIAFAATLGVAAMVAAVNGALMLGQWVAQADMRPASAPSVAPVEEPEADATPVPPPPAFRFDAPLPGRVVNSPFGLRQLPWEENGRLHEGVDIAAPSGAAVKVAADGVVVRTGISPSYGRFVEVMHRGGLTSMYAHLSAQAKGVRRGAYLHRGDAVAYVGNTGHSTGSHLHFEIRQGRKPLNPSFFLGQSFARADDLPLKAAARIGKKVRLATVSNWPEGVHAKAGRHGGIRVARLRSGRLRTRSAA
jgi:murein DD-endopeptidase MepM/ murein hydrolase activator NlpD